MYNVLIEMMRKKYFVVLLFSFFCGNIFSQSVSKTKFIDAEYYFLFDEYSKALPIYLGIYQKDSTNANVNYRIALCYMNIVGQKYKAIPYLENAVKDVTLKYKEGSYKEFKAPAEAFLYLGDAYRINEQLDKAIVAYNNFKKLLDPTDVFYLDIVKRQIQSCKYAKELLFEPVRVDEIDLGDPINSRYFEYNPVVTSTEDVIYFNQSKKNESILMSKKENGEWEKPKNITKNLKSDGFCKVVSISLDGKILILTNEFLEGGGDLFYSNVKGGKPGEMQSFGKKINSKYSETHGVLSADGNSLFFASDRKGGYGGLDLYVSKKDAKGEWSDAENLGSTINTPYNEDAPFILEDGKTLYFSSEGHYSIGGFDYFVSTQSNDGFWSVPINLGYPINTTDDDLFYSPSKDGKYAYAHRIKNFGDGQSDIYKLIPAEVVPPTEFVVAGVVSFDDGKTESLSEVNINLIGLNSKDTTAVSLNPDSLGKYSQTLPIDDYKIIVHANGYQTIAENIVVPKVFSNIEFNYDITLYPQALSSNIKSVKDSILNSATPEKKLTKKDILALYKNQKVSEFKVIYNVMTDSVYKINNSENQLAVNNNIFKSENLNENDSIEDEEPLAENVIVETPKSEEKIAVVEETPIVEPIKEEVVQSEPVVLAENVVVETPKSEEKIAVVEETPIVEPIKEEIVKSELVVLAENVVVETPKSEEKVVVVEEAPIVEPIKEEVVQSEPVVLAENVVVETPKSEEKVVVVEETPILEPVKEEPVKVLAENKVVENTKSVSNEVYVIKSLFFDFASSNLNNDSKTEIERLYLMMKNSPDSKIEVTGHTDSKGNPEYNKILSEKRASSVVNYLTSKGISKDRITTKGLADNNNIAINENPDGTDNPEGRQLNRRVDINVISNIQANVVVENVTVPDKLRVNTDTKYYILLGEYPSKLADNHFDKFKIKDLSETKNYQTKDGVSYVAGEFANKPNALKLLNSVVDLGFEDARIINSYELNSLKEQTISKANSNNIAENKLALNSYTVQISAIKVKADFEKFKGISNVKEVYCNDGYFRYVVGEFNDNLEARTLRNEVAEKGFPDAFVVKTDAILSKAQSTNKIESTEREIPQNRINDDSFTIQIKASKAQMKKKEFNEYKNDVNEYVGKDGYYRYAVGKFSTYEQAKTELREVMLDYNDAFVVKVKSYNDK